MKTKIIVFALSLVVYFISGGKSLAASSSLSGQSAVLADKVAVTTTDTRVIALQKYLEKQDSPMAPYASDFVQAADANSIPWDLVPAIAGTESTFGKFEPSSTCYNGWGYGIYGNNTLCFSSYPEAIQTISKALREKYINQWGCQTVEDIGRLYAASSAWPAHTQYFMNDIESYKLSVDAQSLPISL